MGKGRKEKTKRDPMIAYNHKVDKITKWYNRLLEYRKNPQGNNLINPNTKEEPKRKELKSLDWYINKLRKPKGER
jgi:hypothetical protein